MSTSTFQRLYDSEINFEVSCFWDADFDVRLGDALNGFLAQDKVQARIASRDGPRTAACE